MLLLAACAGGATLPPVSAPAPAADVAVASSSSAAPVTTDSTVPATAVGASTTIAAVPADTEVTDSAADDSVLEALRGASPAEASGEEHAVRASTGGVESHEIAAATWDIDVTSFLSHERVQYYLDFFQGPARER
ncbi:MAG TPA: hypothetical protein VFI13_03430, partial [Gemmatimonadales bacterium]|nr:hypothetical protein [Gemmatimonadales bacterium]